MKHSVKEVVLKNGARGLLVDVPGATVMSMQFMFRAGDRFVADRSIYETAHIMEHMAFGANARFKDGHAFEAEFTKNGAYHNAYTGDFSMVYIADCADFEWERILKLQQLSITQPRFNNQELRAEKGNVKSELAGYLNDHHQVLWPKLGQLLGEDILTFNQRLKTIPKVKLSDIEEHYKRTHTTNNMRFIIAGRLYGRRKAILRNLNSWDLPRGEHFELPSDELRSCTPRLINRKESASLTLGMSLTMPRELNNQERYQMGALNHILSGTMSSRIFGNARQKGLVYGFFTSHGCYQHGSFWNFNCIVNHDKLHRLTKLVVKELREVMDGKISQQELEAARAFALGRWQMGAQTVGQIASFYGGRYFSNDFIKNYERQPELIKSVQREDLSKVASKFIEANAWGLMAVGKAKKEQIKSAHKQIASLFAQ